MDVLPTKQSLKIAVHSLILLFLTLVIGCGKKQLSGTESMVARLDSINEAVNPKANLYVNDVRAEYVRSLPEPEAPAQRLRYRATLAQELLRAGETQEAIDILEQIKNTLAAHAELAEPQFTYQIYTMLGISYLRLGEQQNCLINHTAYSCILPIKSEAMHQLPEGSSKAIAIYSEILRQNSRDLESRWLLNIAYMTLGKHPDEVPPEWLIPMVDVGDEFDIGHFADIAPAVGLAARSMSGGSVIEDFDNDGDLDVFTSSSGISEPLFYFEHTENGTFVEKTADAGLTGLVGGINMVQADYDNDGDIDVFVLRGGWLGEAGKYPNSLLQNKGDGTFSDVTAAAGLLTFHPTQTAAWGDFNNDGWVDLVIANETFAEGEHPCALFKNNGDGTSTNVAAALNVAIKGYFKGVSWGDFNNDGFQDLYFSNLAGRNYLLKNTPAANGTRKFMDVTQKAGTAGPYKSFPLWFWDYDNDGWEDILVLTYSGTTANVAADYLGQPYSAEMPALYHNNGDGTFTDVAKSAGLEYPLTAMGSNFGDLDNDGFLDFYVGTGEPDMKAIVPNKMYHNDGDGHFQDVTTSGGFGHLQKGHGVSFADLDNDGDQDVFAVIGGAYTGDVYQNVLFENPGHGNNWVTLELQGEISNRSAIGARIEITVQDSSSERNIFRTVSSGGSFGASPLRQEIGLGRAKEIERLEITWPASGITQVFENVRPNRYYEINEDKEELIEVRLPKSNWPENAERAEHSGHTMGH